MRTKDCKTIDLFSCANLIPSILKTELKILKISGVEIKLARPVSGGGFETKRAPDGERCTIILVPPFTVHRCFQKMQPFLVSYIC